MKKLLLISGIIFCHSTFAQEMWGIANSNYAGSAGMNLNPAAMLINPCKWEVTLFTADISLENNIAAYSRNKIFSKTETGTTEQSVGLIANYSSSDKSANLKVMLKTPSLFFKVKKMAFGFHTALRNDFSIRNIPSSLVKFSFDGINSSDLSGTSLTAKGLRLGALTWAEAGLSIGRTFGKEGHSMLFATTIKYIGAFQGSYLKLDDASFQIPNDTSMNFGNFKGQINFAFPENADQLLSFSGRGAGIDIGICYVSNPAKESPEMVNQKKYNYRLGISVIDAGVVSFSKNAKVYTFDNPTVSLNDSTNMNMNGISSIDSFISSNVTGITTDDHFTMGLPTALSIQYDRCLGAKWYFNISAVQRIPLPMPQVDRANNISASLRFETRAFEMAIPYSFYDYYLHRIGFAMRYRSLFIGTDKLATFMGKDDITGLDFYFGIKIAHFQKVKKVKTAKAGKCPASI